MNLKTIGAIFIIVLLLGILGAVVYKITQTTETYKAREQVYYTSEPHFGMLSFGCAHYRVPEQKKK